jgi:protein tyrosine/serine phosphatase
MQKGRQGRNPDQQMLTNNSIKPIRQTKKQTMSGVFNKGGLKNLDINLTDENVVDTNFDE